MILRYKTDVILDLLIIIPLKCKLIITLIPSKFSIIDFQNTKLNNLTQFIQFLLLKAELKKKKLVTNEFTVDKSVIF